jgi:hypothetical protein
MKKSLSFSLSTVALLAAYVLSACGTAAPVAAPAAQQSSSNPSVDGPQVLAVEVAFSGVVEAMNGNQWVVDGKTVTVEPQAIAGGSIQVGDMVKVEGTVQKDGSITTTRVHNSMALSADVPVVPAGNPAGNPDSTQTPSPASGNAFEILGVIEAITDTSVTIGGVVYQLTNLSEVQGLLAVGDEVRIQYLVNADGTFAIRQIELRSLGEDNANGNGNDNSNENANDDNSNDDNGNGNGNDDNSNDDNGNDDNSNNDNSNDDNSNDDNSNDDKGNDNNGNDDNGNGNGNDNNSNDD